MIHMDNRFTPPTRSPSVQPQQLKDFLRENRIVNFRDVLDAIEPRPGASLDAMDEKKAQAEKKNYAQRMSEAAAVLFANALRPYFEGILPHEDGSGQESRARTGKGVKKLDVNYSTAELGL